MTDDPTEVPKGPQEGVQGVDPRAVIRDLIHTTLNAAGYWLPIDGQHAIADALLGLRNDDAEKWRRKAVDRGLELGRLQTAAGQVRELHRNDNGLCAECSTDHMGAIWPCNTIAAIGQPKE